MSKPNAEQEEAAAIDRLVQPRLDELIKNGGVFLARKATVDDADNLCLHYYVAMPVPARAVEFRLEVVRS